MADEITVKVDRCTMYIPLDPFFKTSTLLQVRKLFGYVFREPWRNEETIETLDEYVHRKLSKNTENHRWGAVAAAFDKLSNKYKH